MTKASEASSRWESRPWLARSLRAVVFLAPIVIAFLFVTVAGRVVPRPSGFLPAAAWWIGLTVLSTGVLWLADRALRRFLPVVALFQLSLVFPDRAPSRFKTALRSGTVRQLQRRMAQGDGSTTTPQEAAEQLVALAAALNAHDRLTRGHTERVRAYSVMIGEELGLDPSQLELLNWSGLVHDIGKLEVPTEILNKPGRPTEEEWAVLRDHPAKADMLVEPLRPWLGQWAESATQHHERVDGKGYPKGLVGGEITLAGRIVAVADAYDVMTSARSYKKPMPVEAARQELVDNAGTQFDPAVVRAFLNITLGRLRLVMGPLSSLAQFPAGGASLGSSVGTGLSAVGSVAAAATLGLGAPPPPDPLPTEVLTYQTVEANDAVVAVTEDASGEIDLAGLVSGELLSLQLAQGPDDGSVVIVDGTLVFTPAPDFNGSVDATYEACFVTWGCRTGTVSFDVEPINDAPVAWPDRVQLAEDSAAMADVLANDRDADGDRLRVVSAEVVTDPAYQLGADDVAVSIVGDRLEIGPAPDRWGSAMVRYVAADPAGLETSSWLTVDVVPGNDAPDAVDDALVAYENTPVVLDVLANDVDIDGDELSIASIDQVVGGTAEIDDGGIRFVPVTRYFGPARVVYTASDGSASDQATVEIEVREVSDRPVVADDVASGLEDQVLLIDVLANDATTPAPLDPASLTVIVPPGEGEATWTGSVIEYQPPADWSGSDQFRYAVCDVQAFCNDATVAVTIAPVNDAPTYTPGPNHTTLEDTGPQTLTNWATTITTGPPNENTQTPTFTITNDNPTLFTNPPTINPTTGTLTYTPAPNTNGTANLTITLTDNGDTTNGGTNTTTPTNRTITITPVNDAPVAADDGATVGEDVVAGVTFDVLGNDTDLDGDTPIYGSADTSTVANGTITDHLDGTFTYVPDEHFNGTETFDYTMIDGNGGNDTATVTITITPAPDAPVARDDSRITPVDTALVVAAPGLLANDYDEDEEAITVTTTPTVAPSNGAVALSADGSFTYTPSGGFSGTDSFTYEVRDPGGLTDTATVTVTVNSGSTTGTYYFGDSGSSNENYDLVTTPPASSAPVFDSDGDGDPGLTIDNSDGDEGESDTDKYQLWTLATASPLALDGPVTLDLWSAIKDFDNDEKSHPYAYLYDCAAGGGSCTLLTETDAHTDPWHGSSTGFVNHTFDLGSVTHTVPAGNELVLRLLFKHEDMWVAMTADYPSALDLTLANLAPNAVDDTSTVNEDSGTTNIAVLANDTDADIDPGSVSVTVGAGSGTATPVGDGTIDYTPDPDTNGVDTFTYEVCDLSAQCSTATVTVTVTPVNDEPSFVGGGNIVGSIGANTIVGWATSISAGPADEASQLLTFVVVSNDNPTMISGATYDTNTGTVAFTGGSSGTANITIQLVDNGGTANGGDDTSPTYNFSITIP